MKNQKFILAIIFFTALISINSQTESKLTEKEYSAIVLPFLENECYPFILDNFRESIMNAFSTRGFDVVKDDSIWAEILDMGFSLTNVSKDRLDLIADKIDVDFIIFGETKTGTTRMDAITNSGSTFAAPSSIKVYDCKKKSIVIHERKATFKQWTWNEKQDGVYGLALKVTEKLNSIGY